MSEYKIDEQEWKSWPKAVMMRRDWTTNGHDHRKEVRRYVPDDESETLRREVNRLRSTIKCLEGRLRDSYRSDRRLDKLVERLRGRIHDIARDRDKLTAENAKLRKLIGAYHEYCLCNQYSKKSAHQLTTEIEDMICELGIEVDG
jgi:septal ring factor EnvC (AmiA/AmiB activator)